MNKKEWVFVFFLVLLLSASLVLATVSYKGNSIETNYSAGENIRGTINISFANEPSDSLFTSIPFGGSITLIKLLEANNLVEGADYNCSYPGCRDSYSAQGEINGNAELTSEPVFIGFKVTGNDVTISSLEFSLTSDVNKSCQRQFLIDVLDKNEFFIQPNKNSGESCETESYGCFDLDANTIRWADITSSPYCEIINFTSAPAYYIGANIKNGTVLSALKMSIETMDGEQRGECTLPKLTQPIKKIGCNISYSSLNGGEHLVCISSNSDSAGYQIRSETDPLICGTGGGENIDYEIFAQPLKFAPVGTIKINNSVFSEQNPAQELASYANEYLQENYEGDCPIKGCFIPFKITGIPQTLTFSNAKVKYFDGNNQYTGNELHILLKSKANVTIPAAKPVNLEISHAGFKIPAGSTAKNLDIYYRGTKLLSKTIKIAPSFSFDIWPKNVSFGALTNFQALTYANITSSFWDFGDGTNGTSFGKTISHRYKTYNPEGYTLNVVLTNKEGVKAPGAFDVSIGSLSESAGRILSEYDAMITNLSKQINSFSAQPFIFNNLKSRFNITNMQNSLNATKQMLGNANDIDVINSALAINPPTSLEISVEGKGIPLEAGFDSMDVSYIKSLSSASTSSDENLKKAIASWFDKNYYSTIDHETIARSDDGKKTPVFSYFKISITKKTGADESANKAYLIINYPIEGITFAGDYSGKKVGTGTSIPITGPTTIEFIGNDSLSVSAIGMYLSPDITKLGEYSVAGEITKEGFKWGRFFLWIIILLVAALAIYISLQEWYKRRYESHLFKNPNDLYNVITFIHNSRKSGSQDFEISKKLKNSGWSSEQISYALKKLDGRRTGMWEIPIFRFFEQRKIKQEIENRGLARAQPPAQNTKPLLK